MILELQEPFKSLWNKGYLQLHESGRKYICLFNSNIDRTIISYARYLMCVKIGYILSDEFEVDHIDDDKTNDDIDNLQILTREQNALKEYYRYINEEQKSYGYLCASCENPFILTERETKMRLAKAQELAFCSRSCSAIYHNYQRRF
jgi:hypothetical protein